MDLDTDLELSMDLDLDLDLDMTHPPAVVAVPVLVVWLGSRGNNHMGCSNHMGYSSACPGGLARVKGQ